MAKSMFLKLGSGSLLLRPAMRPVLVSLATNSMYPSPKTIFCCDDAPAFQPTVVVFDNWLEAGSTEAPTMFTHVTAVGAAGQGRAAASAEFRDSPATSVAET